jgi:RNA polymerase sigma-70 factor, ECF subfamily
MNEEDKKFIERAQQNPEAFVDLYRRYSEKVYQFFFYRIGFREDIAEDLMQETFMNALRHLSSYRDTGASYLTYLLRIAHNILVNFYRSKGSAPSTPIDELGDDADICGEDPRITLERKQLAQTVWNSLQNFSLLERTIISLRFEHDLPIKEIAEKVGKSENAVKLTLLRVRKKILASDILADAKSSS